MTERKVIAVVGATSAINNAVVDALVAIHPKFQVIVISPISQQTDFDRLYGPGMVISRTADMANEESLASILSGVTSLFFATNPSFDEKRSKKDMNSLPLWEVEQGRIMIAAANRIHLHHIIYLSVSNADENTEVPFYDSKYEIEKLIVASDLPYTILAPAFFMEDWFSRQTNELGMSYQAKKKVITGLVRGKTKMQLISVKDIGRFVVLALLEPAFLNSRVNLATEALTGKEMALIYSKHLGKKVRWQQIMPPWLAYALFPGLYRCMKWSDSEGFSANVLHCRELLGGSYQSFEMTVRENLPAV